MEGAKPAWLCLDDGARKAVISPFLGTVWYDKHNDRPQQGGCDMGIYLNPSSIGFKRSLNSEIYVDKTGLIEKTNALLDTEQKFICVSRPRRFGKSVNMLSAYDEAAGLKSLDIPSLLSVVGLV